MGFELVQKFAEPPSQKGKKDKSIKPTPERNEETHIRTTEQLKKLFHTNCLIKNTETNVELKPCQNWHSKARDFPIYL